MNDKVKAAVQTILDELNGGNQREIAIAILDTVRSDHRTLQQAFWSTMLKAQMSYADSRHDLRNEDAVRLAEEVKKLAVSLNMDMGLRYI